MTRYKIDARLELHTVEGKIASNRKLVMSTDKAQTARICDATLPSLERRAAELRQEIETLPERPALSFRASSNIRFPVVLANTDGTVPACYDPGPLPEFLRRLE
jgi:hypothetical protein